MLIIEGLIGFVGFLMILSVVIGIIPVILGSIKDINIVEWGIFGSMFYFKASVEHMVLVTSIIIIVNILSLKWAKVILIISIECLLVLLRGHRW